MTRKTRETSESLAARFLARQEARRRTTPVWITTYALTSGIRQVPGRVVGSSVFYDKHGAAHGRDWHLTEAAALARAEEVRLAKIKSLTAQIEKLRRLTFTSGDIKR
jgi:hypothetical protein